MTTKDEALKLALEKFQSMNHKDSIFRGEFEVEIAEIEAALTQPEKEPKNLERHEANVKKFLGVPQPKEQEPKKDLMFATVAMQERENKRIENIVATLEKIKQEQIAEKAQPKEQEPVAWYVDFGNEDEPNYACVGKKPDEPTATVRPLVFGDIISLQRKPEQEPVAQPASEEDMKVYQAIAANYYKDLAPPQRKPMTDGVLVPLDVLEAAASSLGSFCSDEGWGDLDMQNMDNLLAYIAQHKATNNIK